MPKHLKLLKSENIEEMFLAEALGHAAAYDIFHPGKKKILLSRGAMVEPRTVSLLATHGIDRIFVFRKPRISILVVAENLIQPGLPCEAGKGYDFSVAALKASLETMKIRPVFVRRLKGKPKAVGRIISFALNQSDIVVLVFKEFEQGLREFREFLTGLSAQFVFPGSKDSPNPAPDKSNKTVFCLPYDSETIFESFDQLLQPSIWKFMGRKL